MPLWPIDFKGVVRGAAECWKVYTGYEVILLLMPLVVRNKVSIIKAAGAGIGCCGFLLFIIVLMIIGVMTVQVSLTNPYHRPWVLLITPLLLFSTVSLDSAIEYKMLDQFTMFMGLAVPAIFLPLSLFKAWLKAKNANMDGTVSCKN